MSDKHEKDCLCLECATEHAIGEAEKAGSSFAAPAGSAIPLATPDEKRSGWTLRYSLLDEITDAVNAKSEDGICIEHTEAVILELSKRGHVLISPNTKVSDERT